MANFIVVVGYLIPTKRPAAIQILTLNGTTFEIEEKGVTKRFPLDTAKEPAYRFFLDPEADVWVSAKAAALAAQLRGPSQGGTIYKYVDDGGTWSKSNDDLGPPPKTPWEDNPPPKDPTEDLAIGIR
jgi:hypothetical protein